MGFVKPIHVGGLGAVVLTLATQNLAQELVGGLAMKIQSDVAVGDEVKLGDGTGGIIHHLGWVSSSIRGYVRASIAVHVLSTTIVTMFNLFLRILSRF